MNELKQSGSYTTGMYDSMVLCHTWGLFSERTSQGRDASV